MPRSTRQPRLLGQRECAAARRCPTTTRSAASRSPLSRCTALRVDAPWPSSPRWKTTPCSSCSAADEVAELRAQHALERHAPRARRRAPRCPRARSDAATSSPMKLAPMTTARRAVSRARDDRAAVGERAQVVDVRAGRRRDIASRTGVGAGGEEQRAVARASCRRRASTRRARGSIAVTRRAEHAARSSAPRRSRAGAAESSSSGALPAR